MAEGEEDPPLGQGCHRRLQVEDQAKNDMSKATPIAGYECEVVKLPDHLQTECPICLQILREPHLVTCCCRKFCKSCIKRVKEAEKACPFCNEEEYTLVYEKALERTLKSLQVRCTHTKEGCEWVGELGQLDLHLNSDPEMGKRLIGCQFAEIKCSYCNQYFQRCCIEAHEVDICPQRPFTCDFCDDYDSTHDEIVNNHWAICKCYPIACPNKCGTIPERQHVEKHVNTECPFTVVDCDFCYIGCDIQLPRKEMSEHIKENSFSHITLLALHNQKLAEENRKLTMKMAERDEQLVQLKSDLMKEMDELAKNNLALQGEIAELRKQQEENRKAVVSTLTEEGEARKKEIAKLQTQQTKASTKEDLDTKRLKEQVSALDRKQNTLQEEHDKLQLKQVDFEKTMQKQKQDTRLMHLHMGLLPFEIEMPKFSQHKGNNDQWHSPPFYTYPQGYKMCLRVDANGFDDGKGTHISVFACLMQGDFDDHLKWPFRGNITVGLLDQQGEEQYTMAIHYTGLESRRYAGRVTDRKIGDGWGFTTFIRHTELVHQYVKKDCLCFRVS